MEIFGAIRRARVIFLDPWEWGEESTFLRFRVITIRFREGRYLYNIFRDIRGRYATYVPYEWSPDSRESSGQEITSISEEDSSLVSWDYETRSRATSYITADDVLSFGIIRGRRRREPEPSGYLETSMVCFP